MSHGAKKQNMQTYPEKNALLLAEHDDDDFFIFSLALDETTNQFILSRVTDGDQLMRALKEKIPDILFLDMLMPCHDGLHCLREIRKDETYDHMPIIIYSSVSSPKHIQLGFDQKANRFLYKPSSLTDLKNSLQSIFSGDWKNGRVFPALADFVIAN